MSMVLKMALKLVTIQDNANANVMSLDCSVISVRMVIKVSPIVMVRN